VGEVLSGYDTDPVALVNGALFDVAYDGWICGQGDRFHSMCEHHMLPFFGRARSLTAGREVIGLSKIPRIVDMLPAASRCRSA
jgi:GTP cyclohydrolase I